MYGRRLKRELDALARRYGVELTSTARVPLLPPVDDPQVLVGLASTFDIDCERVQFQPRAFGELKDLPPLKFEHDAPAGRIDHLEYDDKGQLRIRATVTHPQARRCGAFSVAARVRDYTIHHADSRHFHAVVHRAELAEISLVAAPVNPFALVTNRFRALAPASDPYSALIARLGALIERTQEQLRA